MAKKKRAPEQGKKLLKLAGEEGLLAEAEAIADVLWGAAVDGPDSLADGTAPALTRMLRERLKQVRAVVEEVANA